MHLSGHNGFRGNLLLHNTPLDFLLLLLYLVCCWYIFFGSSVLDADNWRIRHTMDQSGSSKNSKIANQSDTCINSASAKVPNQNDQVRQIEKQMEQLKVDEAQQETVANDAQQKFTCKDHEGKAVDWFIAIKKSNSKRFVYVSNVRDNSWTEGEDISSASPVQQTLQQALDENPKAAADRRSELYAYSDHPPQGDRGLTGGHMKGVILFGTGNEDTGFWMTHSVPQFPDFADPPSMWENIDKIDGQSFFCATLNKGEILNIFSQVLLMAQCQYYVGNPNSIADRFPQFGWKYYSISMTSTLSVFVKPPFMNIDINNESNNFVKFFVQSYRLGTSPPLPSSKKVINVAATKFTDTFGVMRFTSDNSKWSIAEVKDNEQLRMLVCIGDLDRVEAHMTRGGCLVCLESRTVSQLFKTAINAGMAQLLDQQQPNSPDLQDGSFPCKIGKKKPVDWFVLVKQSDGLKFQYISSQNDAEWISGDSVTDNFNNPLKSTLDQAFAEKSIQPSQRMSTIYAYSDQPPFGRDRSDLAHAKGVVMTGSIAGFWLVHSMPMFPDLSKPSYSWPPGKGLDGWNTQNGQIFFCLTFNAPEAWRSIRRQIHMMQPNFFYPQDHKTTKYVSNMRSSRLQSLGGVEFLHVSKHSSFIEDIYEIVSRLLDGKKIADRIKLDRKLYVQSHTAGGGVKLPDTPSVQSILCTKFPDLPEMKAGCDHSKWCITIDRRMPYFCIGDLNRKKSQKTRGGGALCFMHIRVRGQFWEAICELEPKCETS